jgi:hypothetical protein
MVFMAQNERTQNRETIGSTSTSNAAREARNTWFHNANQPILITSVMRRFITGARILLNEREKTFPGIGIIGGAVGIGKTMAACHLQQTLVQEVSLQPSLMLTASPFLTPFRLASRLLQLLEVSTYPTYDFNQVLSVTLRQRQIHLLLIDNADLLQGETWEMLRLLSDETPCSLLLIGHPFLRRRLEQYPYLIDRVRIALDLPPVSFDEILNVILPHLAGDRWAFHPEDEKDQRLAEELWSHVTPSLRRLRNVLDIASALAHMRHEASITPTCLAQALQWIPRTSTRGSTEGEEMVSLSTNSMANKRRAEGRGKSEDVAERKRVRLYSLSSEYR